MMMTKCRWQGARYRNPLCLVSGVLPPDRSVRLAHRAGQRSLRGNAAAQATILRGPRTSAAASEDDAAVYRLAGARCMDPGPTFATSPA